MPHVNERLYRCCALVTCENEVAINFDLNYIDRAVPIRSRGLIGSSGSQLVSSTSADTNDPLHSMAGKAPTD
jgi:hypothetical protein